MPTSSHLLSHYVLSHGTNSHVILLSPGLQIRPTGSVPDLQTKANAVFLIIYFHPLCNQSMLCNYKIDGKCQMKINGLFNF